MYNNIDEYKEGAIEIYELLREKCMGLKETLIDMFFFSNLLSAKDSIFVEGTYFLFIYEDKSVLVVSKKGKVIRENDVTQYVDRSVKFKKFKYDGYVYKKFRKI